MSRNLIESRSLILRQKIDYNHTQVEISNQLYGKIAHILYK